MDIPPSQAHNYSDLVKEGKALKKDQQKEFNHQLAAQETDGEYVEFSKELADPNDVKAMARMKEADQRAKKQ